MILLLTIISINPDTFYMGGLKDNFALQVEGGGVVEAYFRFFYVNLISLNLGICDDLIKTPFEWLSKFYTFLRNIIIL